MTATVRMILLSIGTATVLAACWFKPLSHETNTDEAKPAMSDEADKKPSDANDKPLPFSHGKTFATLDDYLAYRRKQGVTDIPFYQLRENGLYERIVGRTPPGYEPEFFTREQLLEKYGFEE